MSINPEWVSPAPYETNDMESSPTNTVVSTIKTGRSPKEALGLAQSSSDGDARCSACIHHPVKRPLCTL